MTPPRTPDKNRSLCVVPWIGREVRADGTISVCCTSLFSLKDTQGHAIKLAEISSPAEIDSNESLNHLKKALLDGQKPKDCIRCWNEEAGGALSRRKKMNRQFAAELRQIEKSPDAPMPVELFDFKVGNRCNQKCLICGPAASSLWIKEHASIYGSSEFLRVDNITDQTFPLLLGFIAKSSDIHIAGGEPFMHEKEIIELLSPSILDGSSKKKMLTIPTNGSFYPERLIQDVFPKFKEVRIIMAADGIGEQFEYLRYPAKWDRFLENYRRIKQTPFFWGITITMNSVNVFNLSDYLKFWDGLSEPRVWVGYLNSPEIIAVENLPKSVRDRICRRWLKTNYDLPQMAMLILDLHRYLQHFPGGADPREMMNWIGRHDTYRKLKFADTFGEYNAMLTETHAD